MKGYKTLLSGACALIISASLFIGYNLRIDTSKAKVGKLEKKNVELIELLKEQTELNDIHSATIEDMTNKLEIHFTGIEKQFIYNEELSH